MNVVLSQTWDALRIEPGKSIQNIYLKYKSFTLITPTANNTRGISCMVALQCGTEIYKELDAILENMPPVNINKLRLINLSPP